MQRENYTDEEWADLMDELRMATDCDLCFRHEEPFTADGEDETEGTD